MSDKPMRGKPFYIDPDRFPMPGDEPKYGPGPFKGTSVLMTREAREQLKDENSRLKSGRASLADALNTELRENYGAAFQVGMDDDFRPAIQRLVDGVRYGERLQTQKRLAELEAAVQAWSDAWAGAEATLDHLASADCTCDLPAGDVCDSCEIRHAVRAFRKAAEAKEEGEG